MVVQRNQFHVVLEHVHYLFQLVGVAQRECEQYIVSVELRFLHCCHIKKLRQLQGDERKEIVQKMS